MFSGFPWYLCISHPGFLCSLRRDQFVLILDPNSLRTLIKSRVAQQDVNFCLLVLYSHRCEDEKRGRQQRKCGFPCQSLDSPCIFFSVKGNSPNLSEGQQRYPRPSHFFFFFLVLFWEVVWQQLRRGATAFSSLRASWLGQKGRNSPQWDIQKLVIFFTLLVLGSTRALVLYAPPPRTK